MNANCEFGYNIFDTNYSLPLTEDSCEKKEQILLVATLSFAKYGYSAVSMRDLAKILGMKSSSIYNYYESKEALWHEVIDHAGLLYSLYFDMLRDKVAAAATFEEVLEAIFLEPKRLLNVFTCYAFSMIQTEQFRDEQAGRLFEEIFMTYAIDCMRRWFDMCIDKGLVRPFDTQTVATIIMHSVLMGLQIEVHHLLQHPYKPPYDSRKMMHDVQKFILWAINNADEKDVDPDPRGPQPANFVVIHPTEVMA